MQKQRITAYEEYAKVIGQAYWEAFKQAISSDTGPGENVEILVAEVAGQIVGSVALWQENTDAYEGLTTTSLFPEIRTLAVAPQMRNQGLAKALVAECIRRAKARDCQYIGLHTMDFMESAVHLYESLGFERAPQLDFETPVGSVTVKAYQLPLQG
ncbi:GNAT family N-acetyltransferase [Alicyclobacillus fodiniaquatilis]|uniref:GNAT family N-acetyltransferase n=1 Tax=Alicyclobacillus fodiniaquatilis TaxID=1661150 RepID=A0ABW4JKN1_9BACL